MISSPWLLLALNVVVSSVGMGVLWAVVMRGDDASAVDVAWSYGLGAVVLLDAALGSGAGIHRVVLAVLVVAWSLRLGTHLLLDRVLHATEEDGRYQALRRRWGEQVKARFFVFFQAQALTIIVFSLAFLPTVLNGRAHLAVVEWIGAVTIAVGLVGEATADRQLKAWRTDPANKGRSCRGGLWRYSRHPNYFFESVTWVGVTLVALGAPWGWVALVAPVTLLTLLFTVTGLPATEAQSIRSRGDDYRRYQRETSAFIPWFPKRAAASAQEGSA